MRELAIKYRTLQLLAHNAHNMCAGPTFVAYHPFLGELYGTYEDAYDGLIERIIGLYGVGSLDLINVQEEAISSLKAASKLPAAFQEAFSDILALEQDANAHIEQLAKVSGITQGTLNMLADMADKAEVRCYKLKQRLGK